MKEEITDKKTEELSKLIKEKEKLYQEIKRKLVPLILKFIKAAEKVKGHIRYWELYDKIETFGLIHYDFERIIYELHRDEVIKYNHLITTKCA